MFGLAHGCSVEGVEVTKYSHERLRHHTLTVATGSEPLLNQFVFTRVTFNQIKTKTWIIFQGVKTSPFISQK